MQTPQHLVTKTPVGRLSTFLLLSGWVVVWTVVACSVPSQSALCPFAIVAAILGIPIMVGVAALLLGLVGWIAWDDPAKLFDKLEDWWDGTEEDKRF